MTNDKRRKTLIDQENFSHTIDKEEMQAEETSRNGLSNDLEQSLNKALMDMEVLIIGMKNIQKLITEIKSSISTNHKIDDRFDLGTSVVSNNKPDNHPARDNKKIQQRKRDPAKEDKEVVSKNTSDSEDDDIHNIMLILSDDEDRQIDKNAHDDNLFRIFVASEDEGVNVKHRQGTSTTKGVTKKVCKTSSTTSKNNKKRTTKEVSQNVCCEQSTTKRKTQWATNQKANSNPNTTNACNTTMWPVGETFPDGVDCIFPPTREMGLVGSELQICAYIFHPGQNTRETILRIGSTTASREHIHSLCPGRAIHDSIITLVAMRITWNQHNAATKTVWSLPPSFAEDVCKGHSLEELTHNYAKEWMSPFNSLKHVYVPIKDENGHWYLMVISIKEQAIYHLDSFLQVKDITQRRSMIWKLCDVISKIVTSHKYSPNYLNGETKFSSWVVKQPRGVPNTGRSDTSAVWLGLEDGMNTNLISNLNEDCVRMRTAIDLLNGPHNELKRIMDEEAHSLWIALTTRQTSPTM